MEMVHVQRPHVDLHESSEVDARLGNETGRQPIPQMLYDARRPHGVEALPRRFLAHRWSKVIAQWHGKLLHRPCSRKTSKIAPQKPSSAGHPTRAILLFNFRESCRSA